MMKTYAVYLTLQCKRAWKYIPQFILGAVVLAILAGATVSFASKALYGGEVVSKMEVGVVLPDEDKTAAMAVSMLSSMDSVKSLCKFVTVDEELGRNALREGRFFALLLVPKNFVQDIITGANTPVTVVLPDGGSVESLVFRSLTDAGAKTLSLAQSGIYAATDFCVEMEMEDKIPLVEDKLNQVYFTYFLPRSEYFNENLVTTTGMLSATEYFGLSAISLLLMLAGIPLASFFQKESTVMRAKLRTLGIGSGLQSFGEVLGAAMMIFLLFIGSGVAFIINGGVDFTFWLFPVGILISLTISAFFALIYEVTKNSFAGVMLLFWVAVGMTFLSGGFIPTVFLPKKVQALAYYMPVTAFRESMTIFVGAPLNGKAVGAVCLWGTVAFVILILCRRRYEKNRLMVFSFRKTNM